MGGVEKIPYHELLTVKETIVVKRRSFLKLAALAACLYPVDSPASLRLLTANQEKTVYPSEIVQSSVERISPKERIPDNGIKDYLIKIRNPDSLHKDDIILDNAGKRLLCDVVHRFQRLYKTIGYGNFAILGYDDAIAFAKNNQPVGDFTEPELVFLEMIFCRDATDYGFFGKKQIVDLSQVIKKSDICKIPHSGNYLFKGESRAKYEQIKEDMGEELLLTSGIRGIVKQFYLFLNKAFRHDGNLSLASRSLAPPGYSYHAIGDFDIGQRGLGSSNFSEQFTDTHVFKQLVKQGYVEYRYQRDNMLGVRYEPWHIKLSKSYG